MVACASPSATHSPSGARTRLRTVAWQAAPVSLATVAWTRSVAVSGETSGAVT